MQALCSRHAWKVYLLQKEMTIFTIVLTLLAYEGIRFLVRRHYERDETKHPIPWHLHSKENNWQSDINCHICLIRRSILERLPKTKN